MELRAAYMRCNIGPNHNISSTAWLLHFGDIYEEHLNNNITLEKQFGLSS
jgi:hypothetical protein